MKNQLLPYFAMACLLLAGCKPKPAVSTTTHDPFAVLAISNLAERVSALDQRVSALEDNNRKWVAIDPDSQAYQQLQTPFGVLLVCTKSVTPYLDGYKVKVQIGNPYNITFKGFKLEHWVVTSGKISFQEARDQGFKPPPLSTEGQLSHSGTDTVKLSLGPPQRLPHFSKSWAIEDRTEILQPGSWNDVEFTVAPATSEDIRHLRMSIDLNEVNLNENSSN